jgi:alpha-tubulin suppressor-like RCC1 family protein
LTRKLHLCHQRGWELFSWGYGKCAGHGNRNYQASSKRVEALQDVRLSSVAAGYAHVVALAEDGMLYAWGENFDRAVLGNPDVERERLPKPVEALRGVRVGNIAAAGSRSYAVTCTGKVWAWGVEETGQ